MFLASKGCFWPLTASKTSEVKINYAYYIPASSYVSVIWHAATWRHLLLHQKLRGVAPSPASYALTLNSHGECVRQKVFLIIT